ncbi:hypothetical protein DID88_006583 [Monilinia fructigena]|uniref:Uncharacterized protein n=1 Tax=Monilinia fructigena TaxID=38457 RepID=A0A395IGH7_9HELO|nr:hypothetical protein DID88_006583 [Monilinia fructigena]
MPSQPFSRCKSRFRPRGHINHRRNPTFSLRSVQDNGPHRYIIRKRGASWGEKFDTHPDDAFAKVMNLNVKSVFGTVRLFAPLLQASATHDSPSRVIVTASIAGLGVMPPGPNSAIGYSASKAAAIHLTKNLAIQLAPDTSSATPYPRLLPFENGKRTVGKEWRSTKTSQSESGWEVGQTGGYRGRRGLFG